MSQEAELFHSSMVSGSVSALTFLKDKLCNLSIRKKISLLNCFWPVLYQSNIEANLKIAEVSGTGRIIPE